MAIFTLMKQVQTSSKAFQRYVQYVRVLNLNKHNQGNFEDLIIRATAEIESSRI